MLHQVSSDVTGTVVEVQAVVGGAVNEGDCLCIVEAMKMEIPISSPVSGRVVANAIAAGEVVNVGDIIFTIDPS